ncbi:MAG: Uncharacterized protein G01um101456_303 [Parcubacteria group bacterium Gr01-1014_56]|nr:MAG: Uncharacterized protein G01um101456_303 [Parcubacteria group bacterium Gr01-1014_56]
MKQFLIPIVLVIAAIALFALYTNPTYQSAKSVQAEVAVYNDALDKSQELRRTRDEKIAAFNTFAPADIERLNSILPDNVDNIHLIIDINNIATRRGLALKNVTLGNLSDSASARSSLAVGSSGSAVGSVELGFSLSTSYENMLAFIQDLEHSLRVMDIESISFTAGDTDTADYDFSIRTYWLH